MRKVAHDVVFISEDDISNRISNDDELNMTEEQAQKFYKLTSVV